MNSSRVEYCLQLANGQNWFFVADNVSMPFVDFFARVMGLESCKSNGHPRLFFVTKEPYCKQDHIEPIHYLSKEVRASLPQENWNVIDYRLLQIWSHNDVMDKILVLRYKHDYDHELNVIRAWQSLYPIYLQAINSKGLPIHSGLVELNGKGILLIARSGTGKSTCCQRIPSPWRALCDDSALIVPNEQGQYMVHPLPTWSDLIWRDPKSSWKFNEYIPLSAMFFLERSDIERVSIVGQAMATVMITEASFHILFRDQNEDILIKKQIFDNSCHLAKAIPAFKLHISLDRQFWKEIEKTLESI
jgi:SynChlorMet cassette protein ScmC